MRFDEISKINVDSIEKKLLKYFSIGGPVTIDENGYVSITGNCKWGPSSFNKNMTSFPIKFAEVSGIFSVDRTKLSTLAGSPTKVGNLFSITEAPITSLEGSPKETKHFSIKRTEITSLEGSPESILSSFSATENLKLVSLTGCTKIIPGDFSCYGSSNITSLIGGPENVGTNYNCGKCSITSLEGLPKSIGGMFYIDYHKDLPLLRLMSVKNLQGVKFYPFTSPKFLEIQQILKKYLGTGPGGALACAAELIKAGYKENAKR